MILQNASFACGIPICGSTHRKRDKWKIGEGMAAACFGLFCFQKWSSVYLHLLRSTTVRQVGGADSNGCVMEEGIGVSAYSTRHQQGWAKRKSGKTQHTLAAEEATHSNVSLSQAQIGDLGEGSAQHGAVSIGDGGTAHAAKWVSAASLQGGHAAAMREDAGVNAGMQHKPPCKARLTRRCAGWERP